MIKLRRTDTTAIIELARGKGNALDTSFLEEIRATFAGLRDDLPRGVVLTAEGNIFCAGLDLLTLAEIDRDGLVALVSALVATMREIFSFPRPVVAAINGHAMAGGALLSLACDQRLMVMGEGKWGLTEAQMGLVVPASLVEMTRYSLPRPVLEKLLYGGQAYPAFKVREMGVLDDLVEHADLLSEAEAVIEAWTPVPAAFGDIKARLKGPTLAAMDLVADRDQEFVDRWFSPAVRQRIQAAVARLTDRG